MNGFCCKIDSTAPAAVPTKPAGKQGQLLVLCSQCRLLSKRNPPAAASFARSRACHPSTTGQLVCPQGIKPKDSSVSTGQRFLDSDAAARALLEMPQPTMTSCKVLCEKQGSICRSAEVHAARALHRNPWMFRSSDAKYSGRPCQ